VSQRGSRGPDLFRHVLLCLWLDHITAPLPLTMDTPQNSFTGIAAFSSF
jgi:hypothetical protein